MGSFERRCKIKPYEGNEDYIFISYSHKDKEMVFPVIEKMAQDGYRIWFDEGIEPGAEWPESIAAHLNGCSAFFAFISNNSLSSKNCKREINFALKKNKYFITIMLEDADLSLGIEMQLSEVQMISKYKFRNEEDFFEKLYGVDNLYICKDAENSKVSSAEMQAYGNTTVEVPQNTDETPITSDASARGNKEKNAKRKQKAEKNAPERKKSAVRDKSKTKRKITVALTTVLVIVLGYVFLFIMWLLPDDAFNISSVDVTENMLWGTYEASGFEGEKTLFKIMKYDEAYTVYTVPSGFSVDPDDEGIIELEFVDEFDVNFWVQGNFKIADNIIEISPYDGENTGFYDCTLVDSIEYRVEIHKGKPVLCEITGDFHAEYNNTGAISGSMIMINGKASTNQYMGISEINVQYDMDAYKASADIYFEDGQAVGTLGTWDRFSNSFTASWFKEERYYNGRTETFDQGARIEGTCINTYPYGLILIIKDTGEIYTYQDKS